MASFVIGDPVLGSSWPKLSKYAMRPLRATNTTAPGKLFASICPFSAWPIRARRSFDMPTVSGSRRRLRAHDDGNDQQHDEREQKGAFEHGGEPPSVDRHYSRRRFGS